jgi:hypothetical protein
MNKIMAVIVVLVLGLIAGSIVMGGGSNIMGSGSNETSQALDLGQNKTEKGSCYSDCRTQYPASGIKYRECKESRCG